MGAIMKHLLIVFIIIFLPLQLFAEDEKNSYSLKSERIEKKSGILDKQILEINKKMASLVNRYNLMSIEDITLVPYQYSYRKEKGYFELERHSFDLDPLLESKIAGIRISRIRVYSSGKGISKIEIMVYSNDYRSGFWDRVTIVDPSPMEVGTGDITFTHISNGKKKLENKKLRDVKNTSAFPVRNKVKENFILPAMQEFYDAIHFTAEAYVKSFKDNDSHMAQFLKESQK
jgi:hypothetical protein